MFFSDSDDEHSPIAPSQTASPKKGYFTSRAPSPGVLFFLSFFSSRNWGGDSEMCNLQLLWTAMDWGQLGILKYLKANNPNGSQMDPGTISSYRYHLTNHQIKGVYYPNHERISHRNGARPLCRSSEAARLPPQGFGRLKSCATTL